jgi:hypothetical protein
MLFRMLYVASSCLPALASSSFTPLDLPSPLLLNESLTAVLTLSVHHPDQQTINGCTTLSQVKAAIVEVVHQTLQAEHAILLL